MDARPLPVSHFTTRDISARAQFAAWRENHRLMFDVKAIDGSDPEAFAAEATTYQIGNLLFGRASYAANRFERDERMIAGGVDVIMIRLNVEGGHRGTADGLPIVAREGDIDIIDLTRPMAYESDGASVLVLGIPGRILETMLPDRTALHGFVVSAGAGIGALFGDYLRSLFARVPDIQLSEATGVASATIDLTASSLRHLTGRPTLRRDTGPTLLATIKEHIEAHLRSDELSVESLCAAFGLSRAALYRLFAPLGGIARYVRDRRLVAAFVALADRGRRHESVSEIAFELKFASEAHFGRVFRAAFGCTPGQARNFDSAIRTTSPTPVEPSLSEPAYIEWLRRLAMRDR